MALVFFQNTFCLKHLQTAETHVRLPFVLVALSQKSAEVFDIDIMVILWFIGVV